MDDIKPWTGETTGTPGQGVVVGSASAGLPPAPPGYRWEGGKLVPQTQQVTNAQGQTVEMQVAPPLQTDSQGSQFDQRGNVIVTYGPDGQPVGGAVLGETKNVVNPQGQAPTLLPGQSVIPPGTTDGMLVKNDRGTLDHHKADGSVRPGASAPGTVNADGSVTPATTQAGDQPWSLTAGETFDVATGTWLPKALGVPGAGVPGDTVQNWSDGQGFVEGLGNGILGDPAVKGVVGGIEKVGGAVADGVKGLGDLLGLGGGGGTGKVDPYVVKQPPPVDATPFTQPLNDLGKSAVASGSNWAGQQGDMAKNLLGAPSVAAAAGNAMAERTAQENAAQLASARGANTALLLRQAAGSADARTRGITSDLAVAQAQETVDRTKVASGILGQAAGTENAGYNTGVNATGQAGSIGATVANANNDNVIRAEGINASSYDTTNATNAGIGKDANAEKNKWIDRGLTAAGVLVAASDVNNKRNIRPSSGEFGPMLEMATNPQANRESLAPIQPATYEYKPGIAGMPGNDGAPRPGVMAQDLLKSPAGAEAVVETPNGKGIDMNRGLSLALASAAGLDKRMAELEAMLGQDEERKRMAGAQQSSFTDSIRVLGQSSPNRVMMSDENQKTKKKAYGVSQ